MIEKMLDHVRESVRKVMRQDIPEEVLDRLVEMVRLRTAECVCVSKNKPEVYAEAADIWYGSLGKAFADKQSSSDVKGSGPFGQAGVRPSGTIERGKLIP
jgi:hypothetical protein